MLKRSLLAGAMALALAGAAQAQTYKDSGGTIIYGAVIVDPAAPAGGGTGALGTAANPIHTTGGGGSGSGSTGTDASANQPTLPNVGANFAASGPYASYVLVTTAAKNTARFSIDVENNSGAQIALVLDDGTAAGGAAPVNASVFALAGGSGVGSQGGSWVSLVEKGRVQVYAPSSGAQVAVRQD